MGPKIAKVGLPGPRVTNLSSTNADGIYGPGSNIAITISLNSIVTVTGNPRLALNSGGIATYTSGSGSETLTFTYTVAPARVPPTRRQFVYRDGDESQRRNHS